MPGAPSQKIEPSKYRAKINARGTILKKIKPSKYRAKINAWATIVKRLNQRQRQDSEKQRSTFKNDL